MTDLPLGDDGFLLMDAFSDADLDDEIASVGYADPEPMSDSAWARVVASAVTGDQAPADTGDGADPDLVAGDDGAGSDDLQPPVDHDGVPDHLDADHDGGDHDDTLDGWYPVDDTGHPGGGVADAPIGEP